MATIPSSKQPYIILSFGSLRPVMATPRFSSKVILALARLAVIVLAPLLVVVLFRAFPNQFDLASWAAWDACQRIAPYDAQAAPVQIIDIDDTSLARIGGRPWSRQIMTQLLDRLRSAGAAVVGFDLRFAGSSRDEPSSPGSEIDRHFAEAIGRLPVVVGFMMGETGNHGEVVRKGSFAFAGLPVVPHLQSFSEATVDLPELQAAATGVGYANVRVDPDGHIRRVPLLASLHGKPVPSFAAEMVRVAQGSRFYIGKGGRYGLASLLVGKVPVRTDDDGEVWLRYGRSRPDRFIHAADVLADTFDHARVAGHMVLIGVSAPSLGDQWPTPFGSVMPGVEILAQFIDQIIGGDLTARPGWVRGAELMFAVVAVLVIILGSCFGRRWLFAVAGGSLASVVVLVWLGFTQWHILVDPVVPVLAIAIAMCGALLIEVVCAVPRQQPAVRNS